MEGIRKEEQTYEKKINNKCAVRGMNTINCWIWQTSCTIHHWKMCMCGTVAFQTERNYAVCCGGDDGVTVAAVIAWLVYIHFPDSYFSVAHSLTDHNGLYACESFTTATKNDKTSVCMQKRGHLNICADKSNELKETAYLSCEYWIGLWNDCAVLLLYYNGVECFFALTYEHTKAYYIFICATIQTLLKTWSRIQNNNTNMYYCSIALPLTNKFVLHILYATRYHRDKRHGHKMIKHGHTNRKEKNQSQIIEMKMVGNILQKKDTVHNLWKIESGLCNWNG